MQKRQDMIQRDRLIEGRLRKQASKESGSSKLSKKCDQNKNRRETGALDVHMHAPRCRQTVSS
jgi:hypothetical protein